MNMLSNGRKLGKYPGLYFVHRMFARGRDLWVEPDFIAPVNDHGRGKAYMQGAWHPASPQP